MSKQTLNIPFSILDLASVVQGSTPAYTFRNSLKLTQQAEHYNIVSTASSATAVLIGYIAGGTHHIRVGSGGIMLLNQSLLVIAGRFGTLASL